MVEAKLGHRRRATRRLPTRRAHVPLACLTGAKLHGSFSQLAVAHRGSQLVGIHPLQLQLHWHIAS